MSRCRDTGQGSHGCLMWSEEGPEAVGGQRHKSGLFVPDVWA